MKNLQKGSSLLIILLIVIILGGAFYYLQNTKEQTPVTEEKIIDNKVEKNNEEIPPTINAELETYIDQKYNFKFQYPSTARLLHLIKGETADPLIVDFQRDGALLSILVTDDPVQYPIPRMMKMDDRQFQLGDKLVTRTTYYTDSTMMKAQYVSYDFKINGLPFLFATRLNHSDYDSETVELIELSIKSLKSNF